MQLQNRVLIAGAGPVGLTAAASLVQQDVPVTVFEAMPTLGTGSRASTFHASTLDLLEEIGAARPLVDIGLVATRMQHRSTTGEIFAEFDFSSIADATRHPYRLQVEQSELTSLLLDRLRIHPLFRIEFSRRVVGIAQDDASVTVQVLGDGCIEQHRGRWLVGADGARSEVRRESGIEFEGFTWPERFLVVSTPFDFAAVVADLAPVSYFSGRSGWYFLLRIPNLWRVMFPVDPTVPDDVATSEQYVRPLMRSIAEQCGNCPITHTTLYRVHQRVAQSFRCGRVFLVGDAAHVNNPLGGMGMNGGIHDAFNLTHRLAKVWHGAAPCSELDGYDRQRRGVTLEYVQKQTIRNKRNLEAQDEASRARFRAEMAQKAADRVLARDYLLEASMITSLKRAAELG